MTGLAIQVEGLSKRYAIGGRRRFDATFAEWLSAVVRGHRAAAATEFWALRDVSFTLRRGEALGVVGGNGAGKSTLLRVLSRITDPTMGRAVIRGRLLSLLDVGMGFHGELTGRDNIYLNAAILGMPRRDIQRKFDDIVAFAEVESFLDTPLKRYSSGMYVRLAFAVAAHLEPDVLLVDEVLAAGDAAFQARCLDRMAGIVRNGATVVLVSHSMVTVERVCSRALLLEAGKVAMDGAVKDVAARYLQSASCGT